MKRAAEFFFLALLAGCAGSRAMSNSNTGRNSGPAPGATPDADFRAQRPPALPREPHFEAPVPAVRHLKSGATLLVSENHALPLVSLEVLIKAGVNGDPPRKAGLATFASNMLDEGTQKRSALELATELEDLAAEFSSNAGPQSSRIQMNCLVETLPKCLELLADVVQHPAFRPADLERVRALTLTELARKKGSPSAVAADEVSRLLFGPNHPWGQPDGGTPASVKSISRADLISFHRKWYRPNNATVVVVGDVDAGQIQPLIESAFSGWKSEPLRPIRLPAFPATSRSITLIDRPGTTQSQVWVAGRLFPAASPDAIPMRVANYILGGLFTSRLNMNLREVHGYSYGVRSQVTLLRNTGQFIAAGGIVSKNTADAVVEYERELDRFATGEVTADELGRAKEAYIRALPSVLETNDAVAGALGNLDVLGLPLDYYRTLPQRVTAVTQTDVSRVVRSHLMPKKWPVVVVGPQEMIEKPLRQLQLGPFRLESLEQVVGQPQ